MKSSIIFCGLIIVVAAQALPNARSKFIQEYEGRLKKDGKLCAFLYEHFYFEGKREFIYTGYERHLTLKLNDQVSSIRIFPECSLYGYSEPNCLLEDLMFTITDLQGEMGIQFLERNNDEISSVRCYCR